ncbi:UBP1-associated protein 2C [Hibiscus syriacus]|uniref:UBP1-associated protein 2C n=1 Tax=Hibiscus syriacus TaxID=106335 RepID=A0A6A3BCZ2_HIBSY|nr:UBP1-associated protein 2C-like [Hibiscus syriacus]XP_039072193.1 UBP1-associated protein 2C-like [Hibiscus syriacus]XP_039072194.1 UBP1-associated protein 2C-like [Hibiscus syriacus]XP_039072195.1 UBP1-associated protein 2C-like [Hibiscus syriacus]KAE8713625.1 UBP1-associated protein 2C [Hibiscus syriacus]
MQFADPSKKRKLDENGVNSQVSEPDPITKLTPQDGRKLIERFTVDQLLDILQDAVCCHVDVLSAVRSIADQDPSQRKLFIRGLGWDTTTDGLRSLFSVYGEIEEAVVILDKATGKSKGYGFVTFKHVDGALLALKEPSKKIDGRVTVTQLAAAGNSSTNSNPVDVHMRKIYVANVPYDMPADRLLALFSQYGEIEEGPLGFDKQTGKSKGFALFVYKTAEGAQSALVEPVKNIDGRQLNCKLAIEGKKGKPGQDGMMQSGVGAPGNTEMGVGGHGGGYGVPGGPGVMGGYGGFPGGLQGPPGSMGHPHHMNSSGVGVGALSASGGGGYGSGLGGPYGGYGGPGSTGYGGLSGAGAGAASGSSLYRLPPSSVGMPSGGYPESAHYSLSSSSAAAFPSQHHQGVGTSPVPRVPPGGMYPNGPPFY